jgi:hypothetical protein
MYLERPDFAVTPAAAGGYFEALQSKEARAGCTGTASMVVQLSNSSK